MTPEERDLRRALNARSEAPSAAFRARLSSALGAGRPVARTTPTLALVAAVCLAVATIGVLLLARQAPPLHHGPGPASAPRTQTTPTPIAMPTVVQLSAPSANVVWAFVDYRYLARSTDRGNTWEQRPLPGSTEGFPRPEISFVNDQEGWLTSGGSPETQCNAETIAIWHTTDAGANWRLLSNKGISDRQCKDHPSFVDSNRGFLDASDPNRAPVIYRTTDGGQTWTGSRPLPDPPGFKTVGAGFALEAGLVRAFGSTLLVPVFGQASGAQYVFRSTDGGATWTYVATAPTHDGTLALITASRWIQVILPGQKSVCVICSQSRETTDGGKSWHVYPSDYSQAAPVAPEVVFADSLVGYATVRGGISRTVDGGLHWTDVHTPGT
jgi:photosystem II stability/assembly factor-like uncharacterized protein